MKAKVDLERKSSYNRFIVYDCAENWWKRKGDDSGQKATGH